MSDAAVLSNITKALNDISLTLRSTNKILAAINQNLVGIGKILNDEMEEEPVSEPISSMNLNPAGEDRFV